jgi:hypothetical protein
MMDAMQERKAGVWLKELDFGSVFDPTGGARLAFRTRSFVTSFEERCRDQTHMARASSQCHVHGAWHYLMLG